MDRCNKPPSIHDRVIEFNFNQSPWHLYQVPRWAFRCMIASAYEYVASLCFSPGYSHRHHLGCFQFELRAHYYCRKNALVIKLCDIFFYVKSSVASLMTGCIRKGGYMEGPWHHFSKHVFFSAYNLRMERDSVDIDIHINFNTVSL